MTENPSADRPQGCFKKSCLGCLGVGAVTIGVFVVLGIITAVQINDAPEFADEALGTPLPSEYRTLTAEEIEASPEFSGQAFAQGGGIPGRIVLDVSHVNFRIVPAPAGADLRLDATYDDRHTRVAADLEPGGSPGDPWTYRVVARSRRLLQLHFDSRDAPKVVLHVPADLPFGLEGDLGTGSSDLELGGLNLLEVDIEHGVGEHLVRFSEPTRRPVPRVRVSGSTGEFGVRGLGNASPAEARLSSSIGEARHDLGGAWRNDADVEISASIGELSVKLPDEAVRVELERAAIGIGDRRTRALRERPEPSADAPTLRLRLSQSIGELSLR
jgi:hypothetical protein